ncbi:VOC family protein [Bacillus sp. Bva_UNVM-123]|uniref:VOC family protein n=1 Tax=Bacillus sp. Bva_UNVM-123 TaxID=2829798 RepID=UPI00391EF28C
MRIHHYAIEVDDLEEAIIFYKNLLGLEIESQFAFMNEEITFLASDNFRLELIATTENVKTTHICFEVDNLLDVVHLMDRNRKLEGPYKLQNGWETVFYKGPNQEIIEFLKIGNKL